MQKRWLGLSVGLWSVAAWGQNVPEQAVSILQKRCAQCHSESAAMSGLKVTDRQALLAGGGRGTSLLPGKPDESLLWQAVAHSGKLAMPPGPKLPDAEIATLRTWIEKGAEWPTGAAPVVAMSKWWAFRPVTKPTGHSIDEFIDAQLTKRKLTAAPLADRAALLRRATFDLHGLPPTAEQQAAFLNDTRPDAWERLIDSLLASPRYGEKWGRHWLDLARYGDTSGFEQDPYTLEAWRYRDYVIKSLNDDKPYDRFAKEQIAGDELWPDDPEARTGTGFYRVGANRDMLFKVEDLNRIEKLTDAVDTTSSVFLGLTVGCARCHDHKFDPIPQKDYYRMQAVFAPAVNDRVFLDYNPARNYDLNWNSRDFRLRQIGSQIERIQKPYRDKLRDAKIDKLPAGVQPVLRKAADARTPAEQAMATPYEDKIRVADDDIRAAMSATDAERLHQIEKRLVTMFANYTAPPMAPGIVDVGREAPRTYIAQRGNPDLPGEEVTPGFLSALGGGNVPEPPLHAKSTGRRKALAEWVASPSNALFGRVMVNRLWQFHFGTGLVRTGSDFGIRAGEPSHPELLDWLTAEFAEKGYSLKKMHKMIMLSAAYQRSATGSPEARKEDPENVWLSHMNRRRLSSEEIRDAVLQASGVLNLKMGGGPVVPPLQPDELFGIIGRPESAWPVTPDATEHTRRSIYLIVRRTFQQPLQAAFDAPDGVQPCPRRNESTTAPQSLALLNSRFMVEQSRVLANKAGSLEKVWQNALGRMPTPTEAAAATAFLDRQKQRSDEATALGELARGLLNTNEFLYVD